MTNRLAVIFAIVIIAALVADRILNDGVATMFLLRKGMDLINTLVFWR